MVYGFHQHIYIIERSQFWCHNLQHKSYWSILLEMVNSCQLEFFFDNLADWPFWVDGDLVWFIQGKRDMALVAGCRLMLKQSWRHGLFDSRKTFFRYTFLLKKNQCQSWGSFEGHAHRPAAHIDCQMSSFLRIFFMFTYFNLLNTSTRSFLILNFFPEITF